MTTVFKWGVDRNGYDMSPDGAAIVRRGGQLRDYVPDEIEPSPHYLFAYLSGQVAGKDGKALAPTPRARGELPFWARRFESADAALIAFTREYGPLGSSHSGADARSEPLDYLRQQQHRLEYFYFFDKAPGPGPLAKNFNQYVTPDMTLQLEEADHGSLQMRVLPRTLLSWMYVKVAEELSAGVTWTYCRWCGKPFARGGGHLRADAEYCSPNCRAMFNRAKADTAKREGTDR